MRTILLGCTLLLVTACNRSGKKDPNKEMDDTARMRTPVTSPGQMNPVNITAATLPASIKVKGTVQEVWKWNDNLGENLLILSRVAPFAEKDQHGEEGQTAELHASHYAKKDGEGDYQQVWRLQDGEKACAFDITAEFIKDAVTITDLDADGLAETKIQYRLACRSDVSPSTMKLVMQEGETKFSLRGLTWYGMGETPFEVTETNANLEKLPGYTGKEEEYMKQFGRYESEKEFASAPPAFISHARAQWMKFVKESLE